MTLEERWSASSVERVAQAYQLTPDEKNKLFELKDNLQKKGYYDSKHQLMNPLELARWLREAHGNVALAESKFRAAMAWRLEHKIDDLVTSFAETTPDMETLQQHYPSCFLDSVDKDGDPIWLDRTGAADPMGCLRRYGNDTFCNYVLWVRETGLRGDFARDYETSSKSGLPPIQVTAIMDMEGLCRRHLIPALLQPLEEGITILQSFYGVALAKRLLIIRAPMIFRIVWSIAQHFCSDDLKRKIIFCNARNLLPMLDKYIDREALPSCIAPLEGKAQPAPGFSPNLLGLGEMPEALASELVTSTSPKTSTTASLKTQGSNADTVLSADDSCRSADDGSLPPGSPVGHRRRNNNSNSGDGVVRIKTISLLSGTYDRKQSFIRINSR